MFQTGHVADRMKSRRSNKNPSLLIGPVAQPTAKRNHPSLNHTETCSQLSCASPAIDFQNILGNPRQTELRRRSAGSSLLNDVNYPATNDSNPPENSSQLSDIPLTCRSSSFKCKSSPRHRNSSLYTYCISNLQRERDIPQERSRNIQAEVANNLPEMERGSTGTSPKHL